ncbi:MAG TPA: hypothetical protein VKR05_03630, partial [Candidatus Cybelea sp.]|nr:hypothetical protein [Candidatus Cybelea sp.]
MLVPTMRVVLAVLVASVLSACSAGGVATVPNGSGGAPAVRAGTGTLLVRVRIPKRNRHHHPRYISAATQGMTLAITGPTTAKETVSLQPTATGCTSSLTGTFCTLTIPDLRSCPSASNCYSASIATYDAISGCPSACSVAGARELSANQNVAFDIVKGKNNS